MNNAPLALVTGSSRGIGRAIVEELARIGFSAVVNFVANSAAAGDVVRTIEAAGGTARAIQADVGIAADRESLVDQTLAAFGRIDLLVNNAGITSPGRRDVLEATEEGWEAVFAANLKGPFFLTQRVAREMITQIRAGQIPDGKIVNVTSISAFTVSTNRAEYCLAKAALSSMTRLFAARLAEERITVFEVCPGIIETDMTAPVREKYDPLISGGLVPIHRWGRPEDVAAAVAAIARGSLPYCTGQRILVDGGFHIRRL
jgi:NAD(P)-dependent dehydrogenase (short-subunit alcohol dehydrogenase family)